MYTFGLFVSYTIISKHSFPNIPDADLFESFVGDLGASELEQKNYRLYGTMISSLIFIYPLCLIKNMSGLAIFSVLSLVTIIYVFVLILVQFPTYFNYYHNIRDIPILYYNFDDKMLDSIAIVFFSYSCHASLFPVYSELAEPNRVRMKKVVVRSISLDAVCYMTAAVFGYLSTLEDTPALIVNRKSYNGETDYFMVVGKVALYFSMIFGFPVSYNPFRNSLYHLIFGNTNFGNKA